MKAVVTIAWSEVRRRRLQSVVIIVMIALASATITLGLNLLQQARSPYDRAFETQQGAHLKVFYDASRVTVDEVASTPAAIGASSSAGPWPGAYVTVQHRQSPDGRARFRLDLVGRDSPDGPVEVLRLTAGRWIRAPGEVVLSHAFAESNAVDVGDQLVSLHTADRPVLTVVGLAVDVGQTTSGATVTTTQRGWVLPAQVPDLAGGNGLGYQMAYRFTAAPGPAQLRDDMAVLQAGLPPGAVTGSLTYLAMRDGYNITNQFLLSLLIAFGIVALAASLATVVNLVLGIVLTGYREIGITKALGFTPLQVVGSLVLGVGIPALVGCAVGIPAGAALAPPVINQTARSMDLPVQSAVSPLSIIVALAGVILSVMVAAALPALRAGRMSAVRAIAAGAPRPARAWWPSRYLQRLRLPRPLTLGAGDAFIRPLRAGLAMLAVLTGVTTIIFASALSEGFAAYPQAAARLSGDVAVTRETTVSDPRVMAILGDRPETQLVVATRATTVVIPGLAAPVDGVAFRDDPLSLGWSDFLVRGRWPGEQSGEVLLRQSVLDQANLDVGTSFDAIIAGRPVRLLVAGEIASLDIGVVLTWPTLTAAEPDAEPDRYLVQLRPGADPQGYAAAVGAEAPNSLTVAVNEGLVSDEAKSIRGTITVIAVILGLLAAVGVFATMLLHVRERSRDIAVLKTIGMTPGELLVMTMAMAGVLGVIGGLLGMPAGLRAYHGLMTQLAPSTTGSRLPQFVFDVLSPPTLLLLGLTGLVIALAGAVLPASKAARNRSASILRSE